MFDECTHNLVRELNDANYLVGKGGKGGALL